MVSPWFQLCDRAGVLYGEIARFVLRVLGFRTTPRQKLADNLPATNLVGQSKALSKPASGHSKPGIASMAGAAAAATMAGAAAAAAVGSRHNNIENWDSLWPEKRV